MTMEGPLSALIQAYGPNAEWLLVAAFAALALTVAWLAARPCREARPQPDIIEHLGEGVLMVDANGRLSGWNQAATAVFGYEAGALLGRPAEVLLSEHSIPVFEASWRSAMAEARQTHCEVLARTREGETIVCALTFTPLPVSGVVALVRDVSARVEYQRELLAAKEAAEAASVAKSQFLATMSHELRTPLNAVIGYAGLLVEELTDAGMTRMVADVRNIEQAATHLLHLIDQVLTLADAETGRMALTLEPVEVLPLVKEAVDTARPWIARRGNRLILHLTPLPPLFTDPKRLQESLLCLLSNAAKFTERGTIRVSSWGEDGWAYFRVTDSGIGMTDEHRERLFEAFVQADAAHTRRYEGCGMQLALTQRFCRLLGGDIEVESAPGRGSTFTIRLPATAERRQIDPVAARG